MDDPVCNATQSVPLPSSSIAWGKAAVDVEARARVAVRGRRVAAEGVVRRDVALMACQDKCVDERKLRLQFIRRVANDLRRRSVKVDGVDVLTLGHDKLRLRRPRRIARVLDKGLAVGVLRGVADAKGADRVAVFGRSPDCAIGCAAG